jgi:hypothetical protein
MRFWFGKGWMLEGHVHTSLSQRQVYVVLRDGMSTPEARAAAWTKTTT